MYREGGQPQPHCHAVTLLRAQETFHTKDSLLSESQPVPTQVKMSESYLTQELSQSYQKLSESYSPAKVEESAGHVRVIIIRVLLAGFPVALQTALAAFVQVGSHVNARAVLQEGLSGLLQAPNLTLVLQHGLSH